QWYDLKGLNIPEKSIEFLLVDGPPKDTGEQARYPAMPVVERLLADGAMSLVEAVHREDEGEALVRWLQEYPQLQEVGEIGERTRLFRYSIKDGEARPGSVHLKVL